MKKIIVLALCACALMSCKKEPYKIYHFQDNPYLAEIWWGEDYDPEAATAFMAKQFKTDGAGGCSSWRKDNFHGRNIDWMMHDYSSVIVHMPRTAKVKYASVGIITGSDIFNKAFIDGNDLVPEQFRAWMPASLVDGINECGVAVNHNIVPYDGKPCNLDGDLPSVMLVRYVLDNCATAKDAIDSLRTKTVSQSAIKYNDYSHFFISDSESSYVVEWIEKEMRVTEFKGDGQGNFASENAQPALMTNYFVAEAEKYGFKTKEFFENNPTAAGVERADTIIAQLPAASTVADHMNICKSVWYSKFCKGETKWYTENAGNYGVNPETGKAWWSYKEYSGEVDSDNMYDAAKALLEAEVFSTYFNEFNNGGNRLAPDNDYWYTQHSVVYDLKEKKGHVLMQEGMFSDKVVEFGI